MKVLFLPDYSQGNPYQRLLADSLSKEGVSVSFGITSYLFSALRAVKNNWKPDILHIHWPHPYLLANSRVKTILKSGSFIGELLLIKLLGIKIVWTVHNIISHETKFKSLELFFTKLLLRLCNRITFHCPSAKEEVMKVYGVSDSSFAVIPHGNYIQIHKNEISKTEARKQLQLSAEDITFLYFGQIRPYKGVAELVEVFRKLHVPQAKLLIVGKPNSNEISEDILRRCRGNENIKTVFKFIPDNEVQIYMSAADVVVLPYRDILTSGAVMLAVSFGKPVIVPAIGCIPDVLDDEGSFLYNPSDDEGLLKAMQCALNADIEKMGKHNFKLVEKLSWDDIGKCTYEAYKECLTRE